MGWEGRLVWVCYCWCKLAPLVAASCLSGMNGSLTNRDCAQDSLKDPSIAAVTLRLDEAGDVWHVEFSSNSSVCLLPLVCHGFKFSDKDL